MVQAQPQRPVRISRAHPLAERARVYVACSSPDDSAFVEPLKAEFFDTLAEVKALAVRDASSIAPDARSIAEARGYKRDDLFAVAEIAYHYLFSGAVKLAHVLFDGLCAVAPAEAYFALALGLTHDRLNDRALAREWYRRAAELDAGDGRPDINLAELCLEDGDVARAKKYLARGTEKARLKGDELLERKGQAILAHLGAVGRSS